MTRVPPHHHGGPAGEEGQDEAAAAVERRAEDGAERVARAERGVHQRVHPARAAGEAAGENISSQTHKKYLLDMPPCEEQREHGGPERGPAHPLQQPQRVGSHQEAHLQQISCY